MSVYFIFQVDVRDEGLFLEYVRAATPTGEAFGGVVLAADDGPTTLEGDWSGPRTIVAEFPDRTAAMAWYDSPEYQGAKQVRDRAAVSNAVLVTGLGAD